MSSRKWPMVGQDRIQSETQSGSKEQESACSNIVVRLRILFHMAVGYKSYLSGSRN